MSTEARMPRADVRRARRQVAQLLLEGVLERLLELLVGPLGQCPRLGQLEARAQRLEAEVVLLVDHDRQALALGQHEGPRARPVGQLVRDEVALDQELAVDRRQLVHAQEPAAGERRRALGGALDRAQHGDQLLVARPVAERHAAQVPGQPHPRRDDEVRPRSAAVEPRSRRPGQVLEIHHASPPPAAAAAWRSLPL
jgi:hypothetical protein